MEQARQILGLLKTADLQQGLPVPCLEESQIPVGTMIYNQWMISQPQDMPSQETMSEMHTLLSTGRDTALEKWIL